MRDLAISIIKNLQEKGFIAVFCGGVCRDTLLGRPITDYDVATSALPSQVLELYPHAVLDGFEQGIIKCILDGQTIDVATLRKDGSYSDGRRPDSVEFTDSLEEDSLRRDITINAMFLDPISGQLYDFHQGQEDLRSKTIAAVGNMEDRILEDKLRMMRAVRFAAQLGKDWALYELKDIRQHADKILDVSVERIWNEFHKILASDNPRHGIELMNSTGLLEVIFPELTQLQSVPGDPVHHPEGDVLTHSLIALDNMTDLTQDPELRMAALFHDLGKHDCHQTRIEDGIVRHSHIGHDKSGADIMKQIAKRMKLSNELTNKLAWLIDNHMRAHTGKDMKRSKLVAFMRHEHFTDLMLLQHADALASGSGVSKSLLSFYIKQLADLKTAIAAKPIVNGDDLIALGHKPGKQFAAMLALAQDLQDSGEFDRNSILACISEQFPLVLN